MTTATELQRPTIRLLPDAVKSRIAAGEVIERPASIVKELVENALDAGATSVDVQIEGGGRDLLRVRDNGCGMSAADLALAVQRHATSKLVEADDLYRLETLGFRGEALPSIGSVSHMTLVSRPRGADEAHKLVLHGGERTEGPSPTGADYGTTVEVRDLFFNLPARKKFLKGAGAEAAACADTLLRLALTRPDVAFTLRQGRQEVLTCTAVETPAESDASGLKAYALRARALLGAAATKGMVPLSASGPAAGFSGENLRTNLAESADWPRRKAGPGTFEGYRLFGLVTPPAQTRANRGCIYLAVNGRPVRDRTLTTALLEAYRHLVPPKRYPAAVLFLECPGEDVDLNVHPAKSEVRFRIPGLIFSMLHYAVRKAFVAGEPEAPSEAAPAAPAPATPAPAQTSFDLWQGQREAAATPRPSTAAYTPAPEPRSYAPYATSRAAEAPAAPPAPAIERPAPPREPTERAAPMSEPHAERSAPHMAPAPEASAFRVLGQAGGMYMVVEDDEGVKLFDQHALHERILFEQLMARARGEAPVEKQGLLLPETLELSPAQAAVFDSEEARETLAALGFDAAEFGPRAVAVRAVPAVLKTARAARLLGDVLEALAGVSDDHPAGKKAPGKEALREKAAYVLSCKGAIKAGERLTSEQMQALLREYHRVVGARGYTCPHGRPLAVQLTWTDLERGVGRS